MNVHPDAQPSPDPFIAGQVATDRQRAEPLQTSSPATPFVDPEWVILIIFVISDFNRSLTPSLSWATYFRHCRMLIDLADEDMPHEDIVVSTWKETRGH